MDADAFPAELRLSSGASEADRDFLAEEINAYNMARTGLRDFQELMLVLRDANGEIAAGVAGWTWGGGCQIQFLWVREEWRGAGVGGCLLRLAEAEAVTRGCGIVVLDTHSFQAPEFYLKHGYELTGVVEGFPRGERKHYFHKPLSGAASPEPEPEDTP